MEDHDRSPTRHAQSSGFGGMLASRVDLLSQMLDLLRLQGELVFSADLNHPWGLRFEPGPAYFFVVLEGKLIAQVGHDLAVEAVAGDLIMLPRGVGHTLSDGSDAAPTNASDLMEEQFTVERLGLRHGGNGEKTKLLAGAFRFESTTVPWVSSALPGVIHIKKSGGQTGGWLEGLAHFMMVEAQTVHPGSSVMISRIIDVLIIRVIRTWAQTKNPGDTGWMGALADPRISRALKAIHEEPFRRWSVADLASAVGMSRSAFAERFSLLVKEAPLSYQNRWRLTLAHWPSASGQCARKRRSEASGIRFRIGFQSRLQSAIRNSPGRCQIGRSRLMTQSVESLEASSQMSAFGDSWRDLEHLIRGRDPSLARRCYDSAAIAAMPHLKPRPAQTPAPRPPPSVAPDE